MAFIGNGIGSVSRILPKSTRHFRSSCPAMVQKGDSIPDVELMTLKDGAPSPVQAGTIFNGRKVAMITIPGALTTTCQKTHVPQWVQHADELKSKGVDEIVCLAVNDPFVMSVFEKEVDANGKITFLSDGGAALTKAIGIDIDTGNFGGVRSKRGSYLIEDGKFTEVNIEADGTSYKGPSKPETVLGQL